MRGSVLVPGGGAAGLSPPLLPQALWGLQGPYPRGAPLAVQPSEATALAVGSHTLWAPATPVTLRARPQGPSCHPVFVLPTGINHLLCAGCAVGSR